MLSRLRRLTAKSADPRRKILLWATILGLICGVTEFGEPLENYMRVARNWVRVHDASGEIVVVGIDERSVAALGKWPWPRRYHAQLFDRLNELGAKTIGFDLLVSEQSSPRDDQLLEEALARSNAKVILATRYFDNPGSQQRAEVAPLLAFQKHVTTASIDAWRNGFGEIMRLPYVIEFHGRLQRSMAAEVSGTSGNLGKTFMIDYSIDVRSVRMISALDVLYGKVEVDAVAGKIIMIGLASDNLGDIQWIPGHGFRPGVLTHVLGAETLLKGRPIELGWLLPFVCGFVIAAAHLFARSSRTSYIGLAAGFSTAIFVPLLLESRLIFVEVAPAILLLTIASVSWARIMLVKHSATTNDLSGLPNLNALRQEAVRPGSILAIARIQNFAEIRASLAAGLEHNLVLQIMNRFGLGIGGSKLYQGDEGVFAWFASEQKGSRIEDQLEGLHAVLATPVAIEGQQIDLVVTFGIDVTGERSMANRIGSALVAAEEAAQEGLKWKGYDPAKLELAAWKLALLGRLDAAIDTGEIWVAYQPKLDVVSRRLVGAEALVRWTHPEKGEISPDDFIPAAEQHNRIEKLTAHVLHDAIEAAAAINARGIDFGVAVNLSARLLGSPNLTETIVALLEKHGLSPNRLTLEVTETAAMAGDRHSIGMLKELHLLGIQISIDDYGTGFSTLEYLKSVPATEIKIDRSFISMMDKSRSDRLMVSSTIQLAHSLGRTVVAEGVETEETLQVLSEMGCDRVQGFLIGRPVKLIGLVKLLLVNQRIRAA